MKERIKLLTPINAIVAVFFVKIISASPTGNEFSKFAFIDPFDTDKMWDSEHSERGFHTNIQGIKKHNAGIDFTETKIVKVFPKDRVTITAYSLGQYGQVNMVCQVGDEDGEELVIPERYLMPYKDAVSEESLEQAFDLMVREWDDMIHKTNETIQKLHIFRHRNTITIGATNKEGQPLWS